MNPDPNELGPDEPNGVGGGGDCLTTLNGIADADGLIEAYETAVAVTTDLIEAVAGKS